MNKNERLRIIFGKLEFLYSQSYKRPMAISLNNQFNSSLVKTKITSILTGSNFFPGVKYLSKVTDISTIIKLNITGRSEERYGD